MPRSPVLIIGGTGVFGKRLVRHLAGRADITLFVSSRSQDRANRLIRALPNPVTDVQAVALDHTSNLNAVLDRIKPFVVIDCSGPFQGASYDTARTVLQHGAHLIDLADARDYLAGFAPALDAMAKDVFRLGTEVGKGSAMKAVNQVLVGVHIAAMAEAMTFGLSQGVEPAETLEVISKCAGTSFIFENRGPHVVEGDYTPHSAVDIWLKDLGIVMDIAKGAKFSAPMTATALQQFLAASGSGLGGEDDAAVAKVYARNAGLSLPGDA